MNLRGGPSSVTDLVLCVVHRGLEAKGDRATGDEAHKYPPVKRQS